MFVKRLLVLCSMILLGISAVNARENTLTDTRQARELAKEAYIFAYPMLENYRTMYVQITERGGFNSFTHVKALFGPHSRLIVRSNNDTLYSSAWLDLRNEPIVIGIPSIDDRYFSFQFIDMYTHNFAYAGTRVTGSNALNMMITGPLWQGETPLGVDEVFCSEGNFVYCLVRTAVNSELEGDLEKVLKIQELYRLQTLSQYLGETPDTVSSGVLPTFNQEVADSAGFIGYFNFLLGQLEVHPSESELIEAFSIIGIGQDFPFDLSDFSELVLAAIESGTKDGREAIYNPGVAMGKMKNGWVMPERIFGNRERMQGLYLVRASAAHIGLYGNDLEEAYYPNCRFDSDGELLDASLYSYTLSFSKEEMPPVAPNGFWSITMYDIDQIMVANPLNRYSIGDRSSLNYGEDGSLVLYLQHEPPGDDKLNNWLPAPDGIFTVTMRIYIPAPEGLEPLYCPPAVKKAEAVE